MTQNFGGFGQGRTITPTNFLTHFSGPAYGRAVAPAYFVTHFAGSVHVLGTTVAPENVKTHFAGSVSGTTITPTNFPTHFWGQVYGTTDAPANFITNFTGSVYGTTVAPENVKTHFAGSVSGTTITPTNFLTLFGGPVYGTTITPTNSMARVSGHVYGPAMTQGTRFSLVHLLINTCVPSWTILVGELSESYFNKLDEKLQKDYEQGKTIFPQKHQIFSALNLTPLQKVKVVILGQDPYPGVEKVKLQGDYFAKHLAMGLAFSVPPGVRVPSSLQNIYEELFNDPYIPEFVTIPNHGCLVKWAEQGVLLLNTILTVEAKKRKSHADYGWKTFTKKIIEVVSTYCDHVVFLLFGKFAQNIVREKKNLKKKLIDSKKHIVIKTGHPSPLSNGDFRGSACFSKCNQALVNFGLPPIDWSLPNINVDSDNGYLANYDDDDDDDDGDDDDDENSDFDD